MDDRNAHEPVKRIDENVYSISSSTMAHAQDMNSFKLFVSAQQLRDIYEYCQLHMHQIEADAANANAVQEYNREMDERNRIIRQNIDKPYLPLHEGE